MKKLLGLIFAAGLGLGLSASAQAPGTQAPSDLLVLLPKNGEVAGWSASGSGLTYHGDDLFDYINGGAEVYREYGFEELAVQDFHDSENRAVTLEIFRMSSAAGAFGMFTFKSGLAGRILDIGQDGRLADYYLNFWKGPFLVTLTAGAGSVDFSRTLVAMAEVIAAKIGVTGHKPALASLLPEEGRVEGSLQYFRGHLGLYNAYAFSAQDLFSVRDAIKADYAPGYRLFLFQYANSEERRGRFGQVIEHLKRSDRYSEAQLIGRDLFRARDSRGAPLTLTAFDGFILAALGARDMDIVTKAMAAIQKNHLLLSQRQDPGAEAGRAEAQEPKFKVGFSERLRFTTWDRTALKPTEPSKDSEGKAFSLHRTTVAVQWRPNPGLEFGLRVVNESRYDFVPGGGGFELDEVFIDNLYIRTSRPLGLPLTLSAGRLDIVLGDGFLVAEGTPLDETRSTYFNGARLDLHLDRTKDLTLFFASQKKKDSLLPVLMDNDRRLLEEPQKGFGLLFSWSFGRGNQAQALFMRQESDRAEGSPVEPRLNILAGRVVYYPHPLVCVTAEAGNEFGGVAYNPDRRAKAAWSAWGGYVRLDYKPGGPFPFPEIATLGAVYLSGDDPGTPAWEGWDPLCGRWPQWSESYIHALGPSLEPRLAYWTNYASIYASLGYPLTRRLKGHMTYAHLMSPQSWAAAWIAIPGYGSGRNRGDLFALGLNVSLSRVLTGHLLWEHHSAGSFFGPLGQDYDWLRVELLVRF